jgi:uncharacterized membrane protein YhaH (DUF805 family)
MSAVNPYSPPRALVADVDEDDDDEQYQDVKYFTINGRIGRLRYFAYHIAAYFLLIVLAGVLGALAGIARLGSSGSLIAGLVAAVPYLVFVVFMTIQRSHDMDWSGWSSILAIIPFVNLIWLFKSGSPRRNRFGHPPVPNTWGVKLIAFTCPVIGVAIIGILAAVALPAYQQYAQKVRAAQLK